ncbi:MAG: hypothetical protein IJ083_06215 [Clostridia bacterium]|nr:hypothetical protein [Clostridia bacterium]
MKTQVIYHSLSGCTEKLARGIFEGLKCEEKSLHNLADGTPEIDGDVILLGYWVDQAGPCKPIRELAETLENRHVGLFCTMAFWCESSHAATALHNGAACVQEKNTVIGGIVVNGHMSDKMIEMFRGMGAGPHSASPAAEARWALMKDHPSECEIALATERMNERIQLLKTLQEKGIAFPSITI